MVAPIQSKFGEVWTYDPKAKPEWFLRVMAVTCEGRGLTHGLVLESRTVGHLDGDTIALYLNEDWKKEKT